MHRDRGRDQRRARCNELPRLANNDSPNRGIWLALNIMQGCA